MNAFAKDYESVIDWTPVKKEAQISKTNSEKRAKQLASPDPKVRAKAINDLGPLSVKLNKKIFHKF